jgi:hypothetical protein
VAEGFLSENHNGGVDHMAFRMKARPSSATTCASSGSSSRSRTCPKRDTRSSQKPDRHDAGIQLPQQRSARGHRIGHDGAVHECPGLKPRARRGRRPSAEEWGTDDGQDWRPERRKRAGGGLPLFDEQACSAWSTAVTLLLNPARRS